MFTIMSTFYILQSLVVTRITDCRNLINIVVVLCTQTRVKVGVIETKIKVRLISTSSRKKDLHLGGGLLSQLCALFERSEVSAHFHVYICSLRFLVLKDICGEGVGIVGIRVGGGGHFDGDDLVRTRKGGEGESLLLVQRHQHGLLLGDLHLTVVLLSDAQHHGFLLQFLQFLGSLELVVVTGDDGHEIYRENTSSHQRYPELSQIAPLD